MKTRLATFAVNNSDDASLEAARGALERANKSCVETTQTCLKCFTSTTDQNEFKRKWTANDDILTARREAVAKLAEAKKQLDNKKDTGAPQPAAVKADDGINKDTSATYNSDGTDSGSEVDTGGGSSNTSSGTKAADTSSSKKSSGFDMKSAMPLMQAAMQMMAAQQAQQQAQQASCGGPNPAPGCPPQHICFTNPSSLECKCGPYGPGGPECGRPQLAATERNMGSPREKELLPPPPTEMSADELNQAPEFKPSTSMPTSKGGGGGGGMGSMGNNSTPATTPKKKYSGGGGGSKDLGGARGFMGASPYKTSGPSAAKAADEEKRKREDPRFDPTLQGAQAHYGRMLQAGMESARRRTAGTRQMVTSKEVRPASDNIFKAVNEAYQAKNGTFLR